MFKTVQNPVQNVDNFMQNRAFDIVFYRFYMFKTFLNKKIYIHKVLLDFTFILFGVKSIQNFHIFFVTISQGAIFLFQNYNFIKRIDRKCLLKVPKIT